MILRFLLLFILISMLLRAASRLWSGVIRGMQDDGRYAGPTRSGVNVPQRSVHMARDPICGTFVVPDRAVALSTGREHLYFCSTDCRDKYRANAASEPASVHGRTA